MTTDNLTLIDQIHDNYPKDSQEYQAILHLNAALIRCLKPETRTAASEELKELLSASGAHPTLHRDMLQITGLFSSALRQMVNEAADAH